MSLLPQDDNFEQEARERVSSEIEYWEEFKQENDEGAWYAFTQHRREGQHFTDTNRFEEEKEQSVREYVKLPDVVKIDGVWVDLVALQIPFNCMWKSCYKTGHYCCQVTTCTSHTETSSDIMVEAGREYLDNYTEENRKSRIRRGDTHTEKLNMNAKQDGHCVFGETRSDTDPDTGEESDHIHCGLHEGAYDDNIPLHYTHSIGSSLFPADINIFDGDWFITAAAKRAKEREVTRWWVTSDETICTNHGDTKSYGILQHPDYDRMYRDILGDSTMDKIQKEAYGQTGPVQPDIQDGWIRAEERGLVETTSECRNCEGDGCSTCDGRGYFVNWEEP